MQKNGKKYGFEWEGPTDPVHFDFNTNESRTKFLQPGTQGAKPAAEGAAKNLGGKLLKGVLGLGKKLIGDPVDIQSTEGITSPEPSPEQTMINETPVEQSTKNGTTVVPIAAPVIIQQTQVVPLPPQDLQKLDPEIKRYYVVDQFSKATRVEMEYV